MGCRMRPYFRGGTAKPCRCPRRYYKIINCARFLAFLIKIIIKYHLYADTLLIVPIHPAHHPHPAHLPYTNHAYHHLLIAILPSYSNIQNYKHCILYKNHAAPKPTTQKTIKFAYLQKKQYLCSRFRVRQLVVPLRLRNLKTDN